MATIKTVTDVWGGAKTLVKDAADQTSDAVDLTDGYGGTLSIKITNEASGPTLGAEAQIQISADNTEYYDYGGALVAGVTNSAVYSWSIDIPIGVKYLKVVAGSNTDQDVAIATDMSEVSAIT